jgi:hypothetical protein
VFGCRLRLWASTCEVRAPIHVRQSRWWAFVACSVARASRCDRAELGYCVSPRKSSAIVGWAQCGSARRRLQWGPRGVKRGCRYAILCRQRAIVWCCGGSASFLYAGRSLRLVEGRSVLLPAWPPTHLAPSILYLASRLPSFTLYNTAHLRWVAGVVYKSRV